MITLIDCGVCRGLSTSRVAVAMVPGVYESLPSVTVPSWLAVTCTVCRVGAASPLGGAGACSARAAAADRDSARANASGAIDSDDPRRRS
ncbi:hypothetical protein D3C72_1594960 [compost metagenome]